MRGDGHHHVMRWNLADLASPQRSELRRDQFAVPDLTFEDAHLTRESAGMGEHLLSNRRVVELDIPRDLERDEARLLGGKQPLRRLRGELRRRSERPLRFHDCSHRSRGDVGLLLHESLCRDERRESPGAGRGRPVAAADVQEDLGDSSLHSEVRPQAVAPVGFPIVSEKFFTLGRVPTPYRGSLYLVR